MLTTYPSASHDTPRRFQTLKASVVPANPHHTPSKLGTSGDPVAAGRPSQISAVRKHVSTPRWSAMGEGYSLPSSYSIASAGREEIPALAPEGGLTSNLASERGQRLFGPVEAGQYDDGHDRRAPMPQAPRLSTRTRDAVEDLVTFLTHVLADGLADESELAVLRVKMRNVSDLAAEMDDKDGYLVAVMRGGLHAPHVRELHRDIAQTHGGHAVLPLPMKRRRRGGIPDSAA